MLKREELTRQTIAFTEEDLKRLEEVGQKKYRIVRSRQQIIKLLIEDAWKGLEDARNE